MANYQIGVLAITSKGEAKIVLVTTRGGSRWIFLKGCREKGRRDCKVALEEAYEEAGLIGKLDTKYHEFGVRTGSAKRLRLYRMRVDRILKKWPEYDERDRKIVPLKKAKKYLNKNLRGCLHKIKVA